MRRINHLLYEPPDWKLAEQIKLHMPNLSHLNNLNLITLWAMYLGPIQDDFYKLDNHIEGFHLWLNEDV